MLVDYEFNMYKIPQPDCVVFLDVPVNFSKKLMENLQLTLEQALNALDIHGSSRTYITKQLQK